MTRAHIETKIFQSLVTIHLMVLEDHLTDEDFDDLTAVFTRTSSQVRGLGSRELRLWL